MAKWWQSRGVPGITIVMITFSLFVMVSGLVFIAMVDGAKADAISALIVAIVGILGTHVGHMSGRRGSGRSRLDPEVARQNPAASP